MTQKTIKMTERQSENLIKALGLIFSEVRLLEAGEVRAQSADCVSDKKACFEIWNRSTPCINCTSYRALTEKKQFSKLEKRDGKIVQVICSYVEVDHRPCVIEAMREFDSLVTADVRGEIGPAEIRDYYRKTYFDALTGTYNRLYYEEALANTVTTGGVAMIDIDDFKVYNDLFGHEAGDAVLKEVTEAMKSCVRSSDKLVRYGGDEFLLIAPGLEQQPLLRVLKDMCSAVRELVIPDYPSVRPSISAGGTICRGETVKDAVSRADGLMYVAKKEKNTAVTDKTEPEEVRSRRGKVLVVDDNALNREILADILKSEYDIIEADSGEAATVIIDRDGDEISLVLLDLIMPGMNGFDVLDYMQRSGAAEKIAVITITGDESDDSRQRAYEKGVTDYITRPFDARVVYRKVSRTINVYTRQKLLMQKVTSELEEKEKNRELIVDILSRVIEFRNGEDGGNHAKNMTVLSRSVLEKLRQKTDKYELDGRTIMLISTAAAIHDIGKVAINRKIVDKKGKLTPKEYEIMKTHTVLGYKMLENIGDAEKSPLLAYAREICRWHHERYDGKGYPDGLKGEEIPLSAQVVSVCDVYDALTSKRPYKPAYSPEKSLKMIIDGECGAFNPVLIECLVEAVGKYERTDENTNEKGEVAK